MATTARTALRKMGNSTGMIVPKAILAELGARAGEPMDLRVEGGRMVAARAGTLVDGETIDADEVRELARLADELKAAAQHMEARLIEASAEVRRSLDPAREVELRRKLEAELKDTGEGLFEALCD
jgi:antitoxin MazE